MDEGKKKLIMVVVVVVCIVAAIIITVKTHSGSSHGVSGIERGHMVWLKCRDPNCGNTWQMDMKDYYEYVDKNIVGAAVPPITCPKCNQKTGYEAVKCEKCGYVFEIGASRTDYTDRCPKCGYSAEEERAKAGRKTTAAEAAGGAVSEPNSGK
jgi:hypothetical protein